MSTPIIKIRDLSKSYGSFKAVDALNLEVHKGEIFGLLGPNGAGKTTTILMMLGLTEPSAGTVQVCGYHSTTNPIAVKRKVGYMPDSLGFYDEMSALDNLMYIARLNGLTEPEANRTALELMETVGLYAERDKKTGAYSRGMKQRLGLAEVLIKKPDVIILDEPTLGIDPSGVRDFLTLIKSLSREQGITVLLSSHHLHHVQQVCDRVGIFVKGRLLAEGNIESLSKILFGHEGYVTSVRLAQDINEPSFFERELQHWPELSKIAIRDQEIEFTGTVDLSARLVRFMVEKGFDVLTVNRKDYGLDEIYQKYFEAK
ncbi:ABC transporter ATP-binding protein [Pedobacter sp. GR22-6]|uniref:ABC transporter ATP-binding protein n=1 Tax=Pedobacter sp. GR22-6 TaxID=3127957 RepID=UPI00307ECAE9